MAESRPKRLSKKEKARLALRAYLLEEWGRFADTLDRYQWPIETARWHELAFCLLLRQVLPELTPDRARRLTGILADLGLLEVELLAGWCSEKGEPDLGQPVARLMLGVLERGGVPADKSTPVAATLCQAAWALKGRHGGKVQRCLRQYGQQMLADLQAQFAFSEMDADDARLALTHWLQNVLNMPVGLGEPEVHDLCAEFGVTPQELVDVADEIDLNVALLDDIVASSAAALGPLEGGSS